MDSIDRIDLPPQREAEPHKNTYWGLLRKNTYWGLKRASPVNCPKGILCGRRLKTCVCSPSDDDGCRRIFGRFATVQQRL